MLSGEYHIKPKNYGGGGIIDNEIISAESLHELPPEDTSLYYPTSEEQAQTGFTLPIVEEMLKHVVLGANLTDIANIVRLPPARIQHWYKNNYCNFTYAVDYHRADNKRRLLKVLMDGKKSVAVKASMFLLERKYRDEYGKEIKIEVNHTMIDNITRVVFDAAVKYIKDPEMLKLFVEDIAEQMRLIRPTEGMPEGQRLIT